jgi:MtN3 and saliva related transmembrane protein
MTILGLAAGALTTGCWLPQLLKAWRTRSASDFSWAYLMVFGTGIALWIWYGVAVDDLAIVVTNTLTISLTLGVAGLKLRFDRFSEREPIPLAGVGRCESRKVTM